MIFSFLACGASCWPTELNAKRGNPASHEKSVLRSIACILPRVLYSLLISFKLGHGVYTYAVGGATDECLRGKYGVTTARKELLLFRARHNSPPQRLNSFAEKLEDWRLGFERVR